MINKILKQIKRDGEYRITVQLTPEDELNALEELKKGGQIELIKQYRIGETIERVYKKKS